MTDQFYLYVDVTKERHEHKLVYIKEFTGNHRIYWCRDCGLIMEFFSEFTAFMIPEWSKEKLSKEDREKFGKYSFVKEKLNRSEQRLGKGLKDMRVAESSQLAQLFGLK